MAAPDRPVLRKDEESRIRGEDELLASAQPLRERNHHYPGEREEGGDHDGNHKPCPVASPDPQAHALHNGSDDQQARDDDQDVQ